ncbi:MAG: DUF4230 domain-containing protein [Clostridium sp.]|nr:DUF4230 domain-containing protein [Clostridium sp.]
MKFKTKYPVIIIIVILLAAAGLWLWLRPTTSDPLPRQFTLEPARVTALKEVARLSTVEIIEDVPVSGEIDGKGIFATSRMKGRIFFDLDSIAVVGVAEDSIWVRLPEPRIEILESAEPGAWRIHDTWDSRRRLFTRHLTAAEENAIKDSAVREFEAGIRRRGLPEHARRQAAGALRALGVIVVDTIPRFRPLDR